MVMYRTYMFSCARIAYSFSGSVQCGRVGADVPMLFSLCPKSVMIDFWRSQIFALSSGRTTVAARLARTYFEQYTFSHRVVNIPRRSISQRRIVWSWEKLCLARAAVLFSRRFFSLHRGKLSLLSNRARAEIAVPSAVFRCHRTRQG